MEDSNENFIESLNFIITLSQITTTEKKTEFNVLFKHLSVNIYQSIYRIIVISVQLFIDYSCSSFNLK